MKLDSFVQATISNLSRELLLLHAIHERAKVYEFIGKFHKGIDDCKYAPRFFSKGFSLQTEISYTLSYLLMKTGDFKNAELILSTMF